ncbi:hypothetical protein CP97_03620 [Aurantiacibacter atlanticus]|uniref:Uncharacterized protein n=2 Tax=Aurantiacibacter atlanticus TaxID=1648404 RepID=A0A0H4VEJ8_9SPHN|nr:hypothetical protein CP97_03620 [Aurantiacibacter atlanticus]
MPCEGKVQEDGLDTRPMTRIIPVFAALLAAAPPAALAQDAAPREQVAMPQISLEHRALLRCSAAFALIAHGQANGNEAAQAYPDMAERGREFFVRASAKVMDEAGLDRVQLEHAMSAEAQELWDTGTLDQVVPSCLALLQG